MLNAIVRAVSRRLFEEFGEGYAIYQNDVPQGLQEPCFFIRVLRPEISPLLGRRSLRCVPLDVHYFPKMRGDHAELLGVAERLPECLELISLDDGSLLGGSGMSCEIADGILHFFVSFNYTQIRPYDEVKMAALEQRQIAGGSANLRKVR